MNAPPLRPTRRRWLQTAGLAAARVAHGADDHSLRLWYRRPAADWNEALPIGNGRMGAMVFGGVETEHLQLNEDTLYSDEPGRQEIPIDITKTYDQVLSLMRARRYAEAEAIMDKHWIGRTWPCYQPLGDLFLDFGAAPEAADYVRELDLATALCRVRYRRGDTIFHRTVFASHPADLIVIRLTAQGPAGLDFTVRLASVHPTASAVAESGGILVMRGQAPGFALRRTLEWVEQRGDQWKYPEIFDRDGRRLSHAKQVLYGGEIQGLGARFEARLQVRAAGGSVEAQGATLRVRSAREALLLLAMGTSFAGFDKSPSREGLDPSARTRAAIAGAAGRSAQELERAHTADYRALFDRVSLRLGAPSPDSSLPTGERLARFASGADPDLAALLFQYGRYLMIAGSRPGAQPLNLQGLWNQEVIPPWASGYTTNINAEMNYWPAEVANLSECHQPLFRLISELAASGRRVARQTYGRRGWVAHHNTTIWRCAQPVDLAAQPAFWPMASGWLCRHLWDHFEFTGDKPFLDTFAYPLMKEAAEFYLDWLVEDSQGRLLTPAGGSPEIGFRYRDPDGTERRAGVTMGPTMDLAIIRDLFTNLIEATRVLGRDRDFARLLQDRLRRLLPFQVGSRGQLQEWAEDLTETDPRHRHISHLYALHPAAQITPRGDPKLLAAARRTLEIRGDEGTGWSRAWKINFWARLEDGDHAYLLVRNLIQPARVAGVKDRGGLYPNLLCAHPPFQIDGNLGGAAGIAEMLLQSHAGEIHLLPALPKAWPSGAFRGFRARGGFEVDIDWQDGRLVQARLRSLLGRRCRLRYAGRTRAFPTRAGATYLVGSDLGAAERPSRTL